MSQDPIGELIAKNREIAEAYDPKKLTIATLCSHTSLQIFNAARKMGLKSIGIIRKRDEKGFYDYFPPSRPDGFYEVSEWPEIVEKGEDLLDDNAIFIPHGSGVEYLRIPGSEYHGLELLPIPTFGNRAIIPYEFSREGQRKWLEEEAGVLMPKEVEDIDEFPGKVIIKPKGAPGGQGAVIVESTEELKRYLERSGSRYDYEGATAQEFIDGKTHYPHFFASPLLLYGTELELNGMDRRNESNADTFFKSSTRTEMIKEGRSPTHTVTGNDPNVQRESILMKAVMPYGQKILDASKRLVPGGIIGPFCPECIVDEHLNVYVFEISARIVAGSNATVDGHPYQIFTYGEDKPYAVRMMEEIVEGFRTDNINKIIS